jgi:hypothetical protein
VPVSIIGKHSSQNSTLLFNLLLLSWDNPESLYVQWPSQFQFLALMACTSTYASEWNHPKKVLRTQHVHASLHAPIVRLGDCKGNLMIRTRGSDTCKGNPKLDREL